jgi:hypothetical protein
MTAIGEPHIGPEPIEHPNGQIEVGEDSLVPPIRRPLGPDFTPLAS